MITLSTNFHDRSLPGRYPPLVSPRSFESRFSGICERSRPTNLLLAAVPSNEYEDLRGVLETYPLRMRETLQEAGDEADYVYFPTSGIISVLTVLENGMMIEIATVGREGTTGSPVYLGMGASNMALISQLPGESLRMKSIEFLLATDRNPVFAAIIRRFSGILLSLVPNQRPVIVPTRWMDVARVGC